jgi:polysaccharide pyruvyl transferase WcaK-like protein
MHVVTVLDSAIASTNLGDQIIMQAVRAEVSRRLPDSFVYAVASHEWMGAKSRRLLERSDLVLTGGTSLLSSRMWWRPVWKLSPVDALRGLDVTLFGAGWYQYQGHPDTYTRWLYRKVLSGRRLHSVRDEYTRSKLASLGFERVLNTGCPTLWPLTPEHCSGIPRTRAERVVTALNTYIPDRDRDARLLETLRRCYGRVHLWIQSEQDEVYARALDSSLELLAPSLDAYDALLASDEPIDYVGNRLHAGIRALQRRRRALIVSIDNRAYEMGADFDLPVVPRSDFDALEARIRGCWDTRIRLPTAAIDRWRTSLLEKA